MQQENFKEFCKRHYNEIYLQEKQRYNKITKKVEYNAQKRAIRETIIEAMKVYQDIEPAEIWKVIYGVHLHRKSGITMDTDDIDIVSKVISADNSWKKSSGHAFEEMIKSLANPTLNNHGIEIILQRDLNALIKKDENNKEKENKIIHNADRDIIWLKEQIKSSAFDLYATVERNGKKFVFGCIQSKTSVRDRVTRDREPSINAMEKFFWSVAIVLDGGFLAQPKFQAMVNGGTKEYLKNGWHGLYVFSDKYNNDRIYPIDINLGLFVNHAQQAAQYWLTERQWFNNEWKAQ